MGLKTFIKRRFTKGSPLMPKEEIYPKAEDMPIYPSTQLQGFIENLKIKTQYADLSNDDMHRQDIVMFVSYLGLDAFPATFPLIIDNMNNKVKGLIAICPLYTVGSIRRDIAFDNFRQTHSSFDFIIIIDKEILIKKRPQNFSDSGHEPFFIKFSQYTNEIATDIIKALSQINNLKSIEYTLKHYEKSNFEELLQSGIVTIIQRKKGIAIRNRLVGCWGQESAIIAEKVHRLHLKRLQCLLIGIWGAWWVDEICKDVKYIIGVDFTCPCLSLYTEPRLAGSELFFESLRLDVIPHIQKIRSCFNAMLNGQKLPQFTYIDESVSNEFNNVQNKFEQLGL